MFIFDIETDGLNSPTKIHCACGLDTDTGTEYTFVFKDCEYDYSAFYQILKDFSSKTQLVGHNILKFDLPVVNNFFKLSGKTLDIETLLQEGRIIDTLVLSKLYDSLRKTHNLEDYGKEFNLYKQDFQDWSIYEEGMLERCRLDCQIVSKLLEKFNKLLVMPSWQKAVYTEMYMHYLTYLLEKNGFGFDEEGARALKDTIQKELTNLSNIFKKIFPPRPTNIRLITPRVTMSGSVALNSIPVELRKKDIIIFPGASFSHFTWKEFNPQSITDRIDRLWELGWKPVNKTEGHKEFLQKYGADDRNDTPDVKKKREHYARYGWTTDAENLKTISNKTPEVKYLLRWLVLSSLENRLTEWLDYSVNKSIHGKFYHIGSWTHRLSHTNPNMANIPSVDSDVGYDLRKLWIARPGRVLIGVDAESIQLRVLAHYIDDPEFTKAIVSGNKKDGTDIHSLIWNLLKPACKTRSAAKNYIYAWLLGAGPRKLAKVLDCKVTEAAECGEKILNRFKNLRILHKETIPKDALRGWFIGLDGRGVRIPGNSYEERKRLVLAGYLQNGEAVIMKMAMVKWYSKLRKEGIEFYPVNFVHDEFQTETLDNKEIAGYVARVQMEALREVGDELGLRCPIAGSNLSQTGKLSMGYTWSDTH